MLKNVARLVMAGTAIFAFASIAAAEARSLANPVPAGSLGLIPMTDAQFRARVQTDKKYAAEIAQNDAYLLATTNTSLQRVLAAAHLTRPSQLNADYIYHVRKKPGPSA